MPEEKDFWPRRNDRIRKVRKRRSGCSPRWQETAPNYGGPKSIRAFPRGRGVPLQTQTISERASPAFTVIDRPIALWRIDLLRLLPSLYRDRSIAVNHSSRSPGRVMTLHRSRGDHRRRAAGLPTGRSLSRPIVQRDRQRDAKAGRRHVEYYGARHRPVTRCVIRRGSDFTNSMSPIAGGGLHSCVQGGHRGRPWLRRTILRVNYAVGINTSRGRLCPLHSQPRDGLCTLLDSSTVIATGSVQKRRACLRGLRSLSWARIP